MRFLFHSTLNLHRSDGEGKEYRGVDICPGTKAGDLDAIREKAVPIAMLHVVHEPELNKLAGKFDQILRPYGNRATAAMGVTDKITVAAKSRRPHSQRRLVG